MLHKPCRLTHAILRQIERNIYGVIGHRLNLPDLGNEFDGFNVIGHFPPHSAK